MAYIEVYVDIDEHLDEAKTVSLIDEIGTRYRRAQKRGDEKEVGIIMVAIKAEFGFIPSAPLADNLAEQSKRELIEEFIEKVSYEKLKEVLDKCI